MDRRTRNLCKRANKGDKEAACRLVEVSYADVFVYLRRLCGSSHDAEDLTQQTFVKVWASLDGFAGRSRFSTWLYRIAYNTYVDWQRRNRGGILFSQADHWWQACADTNPGPLADAADRQLAQRLYEAVDRLDEDRKQVIHLHYYQGLSLKETAGVLGIATSTVKYRLREVLKILRARIDVEEREIARKVMPLPQGERT
jgi:RNA polymerase sigma-70 factor (ECF subfamily)